LILLEHKQNPIKFWSGETRKILTSLFLFSFLFLLPVKAQSDSSPISEDRIHIGDFIEIDVIGSIEDDWRGKVDDSGTISDYQLLQSPVSVLCRTTAEVAAEITEQLRLTLRNPSVEVRILDKTDRPLVTLTGAVRAPQRFRLMRLASLQELIVIAGGLTDESDGSVEIIRRASLGCGKLPLADGNDLEVIELSLEDLIGDGEGREIRIVSGDIVTVRKAPFVTILGGVRDPQQLRIRSKMTLSRAIASVGGITSKGDPSKIRLYRRKGSSNETLLINSKAFGRKPETDLELVPGDIVEVPIRGRRNSVAPSTTGRAGQGDIQLNMPIRTLD
jgi:protein involved in polysaccharide export with SLBB domain